MTTLFWLETTNLNKKGSFLAFFVLTFEQAYVNTYRCRRMTGQNLAFPTDEAQVILTLSHAQENSKVQRGEVLLPGSAQSPLKCSRRVLAAAVTAAITGSAGSPQRSPETSGRAHALGLTPEAFPSLPQHKWKLSTM